MKPYDIVAALEERVAEYAGAPCAVAVDSCTNALLLALRLHLMRPLSAKLFYRLIPMSAWLTQCSTREGIVASPITSGLVPIG